MAGSAVMRAGLLGEIFAMRQSWGLCTRDVVRTPATALKASRKPSSCAGWHGAHPSRRLPAWAAIFAEFRSRPGFGLVQQRAPYSTAT